MDKSRVGFWLLISLIPAIAVLFLSFVTYSLGSEDLSGILAGLAIFYGFPAAIVGAVLKVWGGVETRLRFRDSQRYAELHGWHPITSTSWRTMKQGGATLSVSKGYAKSSYIMSITSPSGGDTTVAEFERALWALQFGDWLWEELAGRTDITPTLVYQKRSEWSPGLMLYSGR